MKILTKAQKRNEITRQIKAELKRNVLSKMIGRIDKYLEREDFKIKYMTLGDDTIKNMIIEEFCFDNITKNHDDFVNWFENIIDRPLTKEEKEKTFKRF